jgi:hypothetical protein
MNKFSRVIGALLLSLWTSVAGAATSGPPVPRFDIRGTCNELKKVPEALIIDSGQPDATRHCIDHEQAAHGQLTKEWAKFSAADRTLCVGEAESGGVAPAYSELESCLQMTRDSRQTNNQSSGQDIDAEPGPTAKNQ